MDLSRDSRLGSVQARAAFYLAVSCRPLSAEPAPEACRQYGADTEEVVEISPTPDGPPIRFTIAELAEQTGSTEAELREFLFGRWDEVRPREPGEGMDGEPEEELPMSDTKWQRRRELMAKSREQASSEEDENPAAPPPGGSVFTKALKVSEGLYQFSEDQMSGDFPCFDATTATRLRRLQAKDVLRAPNSSRGAWSVWSRRSTSPR